MDDFDFSNRYIALEKYFISSDFYITYNILSSSFIVKMDNDECFSLENKCAHRGMLLYDTPMGKSKLVCRYHNWCYGNNGILLNKTPFNDGSIRLKSIDTHKKHGLIYIGDLSNKELNECLKFCDVDLSNNIYFSSFLNHDSNWKWLTENVLESYHISSVHSSSFVPAGFKFTKNASEHKIGKSSVLNLPKYNGQKGFYKHAFVWPNLFISNTSDLITFVSILNPLSTCTTDLHWYILPGKKALSLPNTVRDKLLNDAVDFTTKVLNEDKEMVELQQKGCGSDYHGGTLTGIENRLKWFWRQLNE